MRGADTSNCHSTQPAIGVICRNIQVADNTLLDGAYASHIDVSADLAMIQANILFHGNFALNAQCVYKFRMNSSI